MNLRGLNNNKEGGGLIIRDRLKARWGVLEDKNELAYSWHQGLHIGPDLSGSLATRGLLAISKTITTKFSAYSVGSSEPERREGERARDKTSANVCACPPSRAAQARRAGPSAVEGFNEFNELTNSLIN